MTVAVAWLLEREYPQHRCLDRAGLPERFDDWRHQQERFSGALQEVLGQRVVRVVIRPGELESWAMQNGVVVDEWARSQLAKDLWRQKRRDRAPTLRR